MAWASVAIPAAASIIGGMMSSDAAGDAAGIGAAAADRASGVNKYIFDKQVELQQPFREAGVGALNRLSYLMGISPTGYSSLSGLNEDQLRRELTPQFTSRVPTPLSGFWSSELAPADWYATEEKVDTEALNAEVARRIAAQRAAQEQAAIEASGTDPAFGSLMRDFTLADFQADPGYEFRRTEGMKGVENSAAARGNLLSGGALKAIQKYGQDLASQEYGNAYSRFNADRTNKYNMLAGMVNTGQGATNVLTDASQKLGSATASNILDAGNAAAAGVVGQANAWNTALGQGYNAWQGNNIMQNQMSYQNRLLDLIRNPGSTAYANSGGWGTGYAYGNQDYGLNV